MSSHSPSELTSFSSPVVSNRSVLKDFLKKVRFSFQSAAVARQRGEEEASLPSSASSLSDLSALVIESSSTRDCAHASPSIAVPSPSFLPEKIQTLPIDTLALPLKADQASILSSPARNRFSLSSSIPSSPIDDSISSITTPDTSEYIGRLQKQMSLLQVIKRLRNDEESLNARDYWMKDEACKECYDCKTPFTMIRRKHHCRVCGQIFCYRCASNMVSGEKYGLQGNVRACDYCYNFMQQYSDNYESEMPLRYSNSSLPLSSSMGFNTNTDPQNAFFKVFNMLPPRSRSNTATESVFDLNSGAILSNGTNIASNLNAPHISLNRGGSNLNDPISPFRTTFDDGQMSDGKSDNESEIEEENYNTVTPLLLFNFGPNSHNTTKSNIISEGDSGDDEITSHIHTSRLHDSPLRHIRRMRRDRVYPLGRSASNLGTLSPRLTASSSSTSAFTPNLHHPQQQQQFNNNHNHPPHHYQYQQHHQRNTRSQIPRHISSTGMGNHMQGPTQRRPSSSVLTWDFYQFLRPESSESNPLLTQSPFTSKASSAPPREMELSDVSTAHIRDLARQLLRKYNVVDVEVWQRVIMRLTLEACNKVNVNVREGDDTDVRTYIKVKTIPGGEPEDSFYVSGTIFTKALAHKNMTQKIVRPRILLLRFALEYQRIENQFMSIEPVLLQEREHIGNLINRLRAINPTIVLVGKTVSRLALDFLCASGIVVAQNVKLNVLNRLARLTGATVVGSMDMLTGDEVIGVCEEFERRSFVHTVSRSRKTTLLFHGCRSEKGAALVLRGQDISELAIVKLICRFMVYAVYMMRLETGLMSDLFTMILPDLAEQQAPNQSLHWLAGEDEDIQRLAKVLEPYENTILSTSPRIIFPPPYLLRRYKEELIKALSSGQQPHNGWDVVTVANNSASGGGNKLNEKDFLTTETTPSQQQTSLYGDTVGNSDWTWSIPIIDSVSYTTVKAGLNYVLENRDDIEPMHHQNIVVLTSAVTHPDMHPCQHPRLQRLEYLGENDLTLGQYLEDTLSEGASICLASHCGKSVKEHIRVYAHGDRSILVSVEEVPLTNSTADESITLWSLCKECQVKAPTVHLSSEAWKLSFGKFLEINFYQRHLLYCGQLCPHHLLTCHAICFSYGQFCVKFECIDLNLSQIMVPPLAQAVAMNVCAHVKQMEVQELSSFLSQFYSTLILYIRNDLPIVLTMTSNEKAGQVQNDIRRLLAQAQNERRVMFSVLEERNNSTSLNDVISLNSVRCLLNRKVVDWADVFKIFAKNHIVEDKTITGLTWRDMQMTKDGSLSKRITNLPSMIKTWAESKLDPDSGKMHKWLVRAMDKTEQNLPLSQHQRDSDQNDNNFTPTAVAQEFGPQDEQTFTDRSTPLSIQVLFSNDTGTPVTSGTTPKRLSHTRHNSQGQSEHMSFTSSGHRSDVDDNSTTVDMSTQYMDWYGKRMSGVSSSSTESSALSALKGHSTTTQQRDSVNGNSESSMADDNADNLSLDFSRFTNFDADLPTRSLESSVISDSVPPFVDIFEPPTPATVSTSAATSSIASATASLPPSKLPTVIQTSSPSSSLVPRIVRELIPEGISPREVSDSAPAKLVQEYNKVATWQPPYNDSASHHENVTTWPDQNRTGILKAIQTILGSSGTTLVPPFQFSYLLKLSDHVFDTSEVIIREDEPTSMIAFFLSLSEYSTKLQQMKAANESFKKIGTLTKHITPVSAKESPIEGSGVPTLKTQDNEDLVGNQDIDQDIWIDEGQTKEEDDRFSVLMDFNQSSVKLTVKVYFAEQFGELRKNCGIDAHYLQSLSRCSIWDASGGKSGSAFFKTKDDRFVVKQLSRPEILAFKRFAPSYFAYLNQALFKELPTVLAKIFGIYAIIFRNSVTGKTLKINLLIMENLFHNHKITRIFDLKGSLRNRMVQPTGKQAEVLLDANFIEYTNKSPIYVREHSKKILRTSVWNDTLFLSRLNVMDYSLLVGIDEVNHQLMVGIVDFVRTFTWDKKLESWVKEAGILGGGGKEPTIVSPRQYKLRFREAMEKHFLFVPDKFCNPFMVQDFK